MLHAHAHTIAYAVPATAANPRADVAAWASAVATVASWSVASARTRPSSSGVVGSASLILTC